MSTESLKLKDKHTWKCKPGYKICVLDRGVLRFDYPGSWIVEPGDGAVHLHDRPPSVESCDLGVSIFRLPPGAINELNLEETMANTMGSERKVYHQSPMRHIDRPDMEILWMEQRYKDEQYKRDARFRVALARGTVLALITMNYWANRASGLERVWDEVLRTLVMDIHVVDPTMGPVVQ